MTQILRGTDSQTSIICVVLKVCAVNLFKGLLYFGIKKLLT